MAQCAQPTLPCSRVLHWHGPSGKGSMQPRSHVIDAEKPVCQWSRARPILSALGLAAHRCYGQEAACQQIMGSDGHRLHLGASFVAGAGCFGTMRAGVPLSSEECRDLNGPAACSSSGRSSIRGRTAGAVGRRHSSTGRDKKRQDTGGGYHVSSLLTSKSSSSASIQEKEADLLIRYEYE